MSGIPGLRGTDHIGLTVPDLDKAIAFFRDVIGAQVFYPLGPFSDPQGTWMADHLGVDPRAEIKRMRFLRLGNGANVELFEYTAPDQRHQPPRNSDIGGHHLSFAVDDIAAAIAYLRAHGVEVMGEPTTMTDGPSAGESWVYFRAPWGMQMELVSAPHGRAYEKTTEARLWSPQD